MILFWFPFSLFIIKENYSEVSTETYLASNGLKASLMVLSGNPQLISWSCGVLCSSQRPFLPITQPWVCKFTATEGTPARAVLTQFCHREQGCDVSNTCLLHTETKTASEKKCWKTVRKIGDSKDICFLEEFRSPFIFPPYWSECQIIIVSDRMQRKSLGQSWLWPTVTQRVC